MEKKFQVVILTPYGKYLQSDAEFLSVTSSVGVLGILPNHAPLITTLEISALTIKDGRFTNRYAISGGVMHIKNDHSVHLLVDSIERSDEIDVKRANDSKARAEKRLSGKSDEEVDVARAKLSLLRSLNRLNVSNYKGEK